MKLTPAARRMIAIVVVLVSSTALAHAARRGGTLLDETARAHAPAPVLHPAAPAAHGSAADEESPMLRPGVPSAPGTTTVRPDPLRSPGLPVPAGSPDHRADKREHGRTTAGAGQQFHRPLSHRAKGQVRNTPATPGMGLLLRFSANAGSEISLNTSDWSQAPSTLRSGRAPPCDGSVATLAPAALPRPAHSALPARGLRPDPHAGDPPSEDPLPEETHAPQAPRPAIVPAPDAASLPPAPACLRTERTMRSHASRVKGAAACPIPPFGGREA